LFQGKVQNDILVMPNQVLNLIQDLRISASHLSFGFDLKFDAVVQSQAYSGDLLAEQVLWRVRAASPAKAGTLASDELWHLAFSLIG